MDTEGAKMDRSLATISLLALPNELLENIFIFIHTPKQFLDIALVNKRFRAIVATRSHYFAQQWMLMHQGPWTGVVLNVGKDTKLETLIWNVTIAFWNRDNITGSAIADDRHKALMEHMGCSSLRIKTERFVHCFARLLRVAPEGIASAKDKVRIEHAMFAWYMMVERDRLYSTSAELGKFLQALGKTPTW
ncbi:hypothetical protein BJ508DRAFT_331651 [Ascobolus immersus RN42]|uniref:F-box domain-containing protein n=1 Tax=Ascobolus immersus RN42 TaxID=1160509 RepID=A0A3N4HQG0_ASCIM|nr:hypothetical protein BJ508DRAFT_331651 [Ascobolus immersus RN42]